MMTSLPGVFAGGDIVRGASLVVWGVRDGRDAAAGHARLSRPARRRRSAGAGRWPRDGRTPMTDTIETGAELRRRPGGATPSTWRGTASTTRPTSTTPAASAASSRSTASRAARSWSSGIEALKAVWHRGAVDADGKTGDGAGIHVQIPQDFFRARSRARSRTDAAASRSAWSSCRAPTSQQQEACRTIVETEILRLRLLHPRLAPGAGRHLGARREGDATRPEIEQIMIGNPKGVDEDAFERDLYLIRRRIEKQALAEQHHRLLHLLAVAAAR